MSIKNNTPAETYKDLFHIDNNNQGIDSSLRNIKDGSGNSVPLQLASDKVSIDAGDGLFENILLQDTKYQFVDNGSVGTPSTLELSLDQANVQKIKVDSNINDVSWLNPPSSGHFYELVLIVEQGSGGSNTISWPSDVKWAGGSAPALSSSSGAIDIFKLITVDGASTWYAWTIGQDFS